MASLPMRPEFAVLLVYLALMVAIGVMLARRNRGGADFFAGGRCIPWWVSGISLYMGNFSAWLFTGGAGMIYRTTWYGLLYFLLTGTIAYFLGSELAAAQWRRSRVLSPVEFTRERFGVATQQALSLVTSVVFIAAAGNQLKAIATVVHPILGVPLIQSTVVIGLIVIVYTYLGGLWAVMVTDVVQFVVLLASTLLIAPLALLLLDGGVPELLAGMEFSIPPADGDPAHDFHFLIAGFISFTLGVGAGQGPRFYCVPDERSARKVGRLAALLFLTTPVLFSLPPLVARALWGGPALLGGHIPGKDPHERVFIQIAIEVLPPGLLGLFLAAMFAATMSALAPIYNQVASVLSRDVYMLFRPQTDDKALFRVGRMMTLGIGLATIGIALFYIHGNDDLFKVMTSIFFLSAPVMHIPILAGFFFRKAPRSAGLAAILWGVATGLLTKFILRWHDGPQIYLTQASGYAIVLASPWLGSMYRRTETRAPLCILTGVFCALVSGVLLLGAPEACGPWIHGLVAAYAAFIFCSTLLFARSFARDRGRERVDAFYRRLDTPVDVAAEVTGSAEAALSVYRLIGALTLLIAGLVAALFLAEALQSPALAGQWWKYATQVAILLALGLFFLLAGRKRSQAGGGA